MATEILELEVKSNIKGATKDMDGLAKSVDKANYAETELNSNIELQIKFIADQQIELARLKTIQDSIPKGAFYAGQSKLNDSIRTVTSSLREEKASLKKLQSEQKAANKVIKDSTTAQKKSTNESIRGIQHFQIMGVSIRQLKHMVRSIRPTFKLLFGTIKSGMAATGIGLLILAFGSLVVWLNKSESGAKVLKAAFEAVGNVVTAVADAIVWAGDGIASFFGMASDSSSAVKGVNKLEEATKTLGKRMDELAVKEAKNQRARDDYNRTADDTSKSQKTRMDAADKGSAIELQNIDDKIQASKDYAIVLEAERVKVNAQAKQIWKIAAIRGKATEIVDEQVKKQQKQETELAKLELERHNASLGYADKQVEIRQTAKEERDEKINDEKEIAKQLEEIQNELDLRELETAREVEEAKLLIAKEAAEQELEDSTASKEVKDAALLLLEEKYQSDLAVIDDEAKEKAFKDDLAWSKKIADNDTYNLEQQKKLDDAYQSNKEKSIAMGFAAASSLAKEGSGVAKGIAVAETIYNTQAAIMQAMKLPPPFNAIQAAATGVMGAASIAKILSTNPEGAGGGGGGAPVVATPPAPEMMSGAFELTGGQAVEPARAYVVSDDITANQDKLAIIRRRATI